MDSTSVEVDFEIPKFIRVYKDGHAERLAITQFVPPSVDPSTGVSSKDVVIEPETGLSARLYLPKLTSDHNLIPLVIYFHGGGFIAESTFSPAYHPYLNSIVAESKVVAISVDYRRAPDHPLPIAYQDAWTAIQWVVAHAKQEEWFSKYVDLDRVFMGGDSSGANIAHHMAVRIGTSDDEQLKIEGVFLIHPLFNGAQSMEDEADNPLMDIARKTWGVVCPSTTGLDDPLINPVKDVNFSKVGCSRILVCVAEKDGLRHRGRFYYEELGKSGWGGVVEFMETPGEDHVFFLYHLASQNAKDLIKRVASFVNNCK